jgi:hypothetical protein
MTPVFDLNKLPDRQLYVRQCIAIDSYTNFSEIIPRIKRDMAIQLADMILEKDDFFWERSIEHNSMRTLEYGADCIVITREEYASIRRDAFTQGVNHATGFHGRF